MTFFCRQMKNAAVATTTPSGMAVSSSRMTAPQSVYMAARKNPSHPLSRRPRSAPVCGFGLVAVLLLAVPLLPLAGRAQVRFQDCEPAAGGGVTCDTEPEGNTLLQDQAARFGLFDAASPGWEEFDPYAEDEPFFGDG